MGRKKKTKLNIQDGIDKAMVRAGVTNLDMQKRLGLSRMTWHNWRKRDSLKLTQAVEIADALGINIFVLINDMS